MARPPLHTRPDPPPGGAPLTALLALAAALALPACRSTSAPLGDRDAIATYSGRTLTTEIDAPVRIPAVVAAAQAVLRERGYTVTASEATEERGSVHAEPANASMLEGVTIQAAASGGGKAGATRIKVTIEPLGNEARSRTILDSILTRLGY